ncbi:MAG: AEC family transporter, partial [Coprobacillaceae bacterium]
MDIMVIINQMIQLFLVIALGYVLNRMGIFDQTLNKKLTTLLLSVTTPAMVLSSVMSNNNDASLSEVGLVFLVVIIVFTVLPILSYVLVKIMRIPKKQQGLYMFMTVFSNIGFMGFPVLQAIFGDESVFYAAIFNMGFNLLVFTLGVVMMNHGNEKRINLSIKNVLTPGVIASLIALLIYFTKLQFPVVISNTVSMIGNITTPIAMLLIGSTLANMPIKEVFNDFRIYPYTFIKQIIIPIIAFPILSFFIKDTYLLGITFIVVSMPVANSAVLFATEYGGDIKLAAKTVFLTT